MYPLTLLNVELEYRKMQTKRSTQTDRSTLTRRFIASQAQSVAHCEPLATEDHGLCGRDHCRELREIE